MIVLIVIAGIILLLVLLLNIPVNAYIRFYDRKLDISVKYMFVKLYPAKEKKDKKASQKDSDEPTEEKSTDAESASEENTEVSADEEKDSKLQKSKEKKKPLLQRINNLLDDLTAKKDAFLLLWELCKGHLIKLGKKIRIDDIKVDFAAADEDAYEAAMLYGKLNAAVYNAIAAVRCFVNISIRSVTIDCLFDTPSEKSRYDGECTVRLRPASLLNAVAAIVFGFLIKNKTYYPALMTLTSKNKPKA